jgi:DNA-binding response OmpR family regulator
MGIGRVLLVDEDPCIREFLSLTLADEGYQLIVCVSRNVQPHQLIAQYKPSLILLDMAPPLKQALSFLTAYTAAPHPPIIALSTGAEFVRQPALALGAVGFVAKPFDVEILLDLVGKYIAA